jgi:hypothetical protein
MKMINHALLSSKATRLNIANFQETNGPIAQLGGAFD